MKGTPADTVDACIKSSELWSYFKQVKLTVNMHVQSAANQESAADLASFACFLLQVSEGRHDVIPELGTKYMKLPRDMLISNPEYDNEFEDARADENRRPVSLGLKRIVDAMYGERGLNNLAVATDSYFARRTILTPTNASVQRVNEAVAERLSGDPNVFLSTDEVEDDIDGNATASFEPES